MVSDRTGRKVKAEQVHQRMIDEVRKLRSGQTWKAWMDAATLLPNYSFRNLVLITMQRPDATRVAGYRTWQRLGRQVNKDESAIQILAPMHRKTTKDETDDASTRRTKPSASSASKSRRYTTSARRPAIRCPRHLAQAGSSDRYRMVCGTRWRPKSPERASSWHETRSQNLESGASPITWIAVWSWPPSSTTPPQSQLSRTKSLT
ncbi:ArdC family protein [Kribbella sp. NBC_01245]|uniref:ArdC family protein n=1 Tax=Kribbella sp. NBC_01245 TaxID=2903578 RepID=UPI003FA57E40